MKQFIILIAICCLGGWAPAQSAASYYKVLQGKIGGMEATLHLHVAGNKAGGFLWFSKTPRPMQCYANFNKSGDSLYISANGTPININLSGKLTAAYFSGVAVLEKENSNANGHAINTKKSGFELQCIANGGFTSFDYVYAEGIAKMPANIKNESTATYYASSIWPKAMANKVLENALKTYVNREFNNKGTLKEPVKILLAQKSDYINGWKSNVAKTPAKEIKDMGLSLSQQSEENINVMYEDEKLITISHFSYNYSGGAHGNYASKLTSFSKQNGTIIKLSDVLTTEGIDKLPALLEAAIRQQYGFDKTKTLEQNGVFVKKMEPSSNFYLAKNALGFIYSPYELMSFSYGEPNIFIPAASIEKYIKPAFKTVFKQ